MHDDEFLSQFQKAPRPEFAEKLRAKLTHEDYSEESKPMNRLISFPYAMKNAGAVQTNSKPDHRRGYAVMLVASFVLMIFSGAILVTNRGNSLTALSPVAANPMFEYGGHVTSVDSPVAIGAMHSAEMTWIKIQKNFVGVIGSDAKEEIEAAHANGFKILISSDGNDRHLRQGDEAYFKSYASWLARIAAAGADAIEVWNEPNIDTISRQSVAYYMTGERYAPMLKEAYKAIKAANPNTLVISAAPAPTGAADAFTGMLQNDDDWLRELVHAGGLAYMDCVGVYYNEGILPPDATSGDPRDSYYTRYFASMLKTYSDIVVGQKPLCFTEIGYLSSEGYTPLPEMFTWADHVTAAQQGEWLAQAASIAAQSDQVRLMIVWNVDYTNYGDDPQAGYAIIRPDGRCPACDALAALR
jgi:hypothetical protein